MQSKKAKSSKTAGQPDPRKQGQSGSGQTAKGPSGQAKSTKETFTKKL